MHQCDKDPTLVPLGTVAFFEYLRCPHHQFASPANHLLDILTSVNILSQVTSA